MLVEKYLVGIPNFNSSFCQIIIKNDLTVNILNAKTPKSFFDRFNDLSESLKLQKSDIVDVQLVGSQSNSASGIVGGAIVGSLLLGGVGALLGGVAGASSSNDFSLILKIKHQGKEHSMVFEKSHTCLKTYQAIISWLN